MNIAVILSMLHRDTEPDPPEVIVVLSDEELARAVGGGVPQAPRAVFVGSFD